MEKKFYTDNFERLLKQKSDEFRMIPSKRVWHSIYNDLHPARRWPSVTVSLLLVAALLFIGYENSYDNNSHLLASKNSTQNSVAVKKTVSSTSAVNNNPLINQQQNNTAAVIVNPGLSNNSTTSLTLADISTTSVQASNNNPGILRNDNSKPTQLQQNNAVVSINHNKINSNLTTGKTSDKSKTVEVETAATIANNDAVTSMNPLQVSDPSVSSTISFSGTDSKNKNTVVSIAPNSVASEKENVATELKIEKNDAPAKTSGSEKTKTAFTLQDKAWAEDYAFYNKVNRKKWKDRLASEIYVTPGVSFRTLVNNTKFNPVTATSNVNSGDVAIHQNPSISAEIGWALVYSFAKNFRVKGGLQFNYSSYNIKAFETNHPVLTTLTLNDLNSGYPYLVPRNTTISNTTGSQQIILHNKTFQVSLPVGFEFKLAGKHNIQWYAGTTIQPSYVVGGNSYLLSSDRKNYIHDNSFIRKWTFNAGFESFVSIKTSSVTLQVGPQLRYQFPSTYGKKYSMDEKLFSAGLKFGIIRNF